MHVAPLYLARICYFGLSVSRVTHLFNGYFKLYLWIFCCVSHILILICYYLIYYYLFESLFHYFRSQSQHISLRAWTRRIVTLSRSLQLPRLWHSFTSQPGCLQHHPHPFQISWAYKFTPGTSIVSSPVPPVRAPSPGCTHFTLVPRLQW